MDRATVQPGQLPLDIDVLRAGQFAMVGLAKLSEALLGTSTCVVGFTCTPTSPASMSVTLGPGQIYEQENLEATPWGSFPADTHTIIKQGLLLDPATQTLVAPTTIGYAQNLLIEVQYADADAGQTVRPYYNAANPSVAFQGPGGAGTADNTIRKGTVAYQIKAGTAATSGTQTTPAPDAGWMGLFVVTLSYGQTTITAGSISQYSGAVFVPSVFSLVSSLTISPIRLSHGQANLALVSATSIALSPRNGNSIIVSGVQVQIAGAGVSGGLTAVPVNGTAGSSLAASTLYYVSLAVIAGVQTLRYWNAASYSHMPDTTAGNVGIEVVSYGGAPISTDTLVGKVFINSSTQFSDASGARYLLSWFNKADKISKTTFSTTRTTTSATLVEINSEIRSSFICWASDVVGFAVVGIGYMTISTGGGGAGSGTQTTGVAFDGGTPEPEQVSGGGYAPNPTSLALSASLQSYKAGLSENGSHYATLVGSMTGSLSQVAYAPLTATTAQSFGIELILIVKG